MGAPCVAVLILFSCQAVSVVEGHGLVSWGRKRQPDNYIKLESVPRQTEFFNRMLFDATGIMQVDNRKAQHVNRLSRKINRLSLHTSRLTDHHDRLTENGQIMSRKINKVPVKNIRLYQEDTHDTLPRKTMKAKRSFRAESCLGKCGKQQASPCSCHASCVVYKNCCEDLADRCPGIVARGRQLYHRQMAADVTCLGNHYFVVSSCPRDQTNGTEAGPKWTSHSDIAGRALFGHFALLADLVTQSGQNTKQRSVWQAMAQAPVTELSTGISYINSSIYSCFSYNHSDAKIWALKVNVDKFTALTNLSDFIENIVILWNHYYVPGSENNHKPSLSKCIPAHLEDSCRKPPAQSADGNSVEDYLIAEKCSSFFSFVKVGHAVYKNKYCAMCNLNKHIKVSHLESLTIKIPERSVYLLDISQGFVSLTYDYGDRHKWKFRDTSSYGSWTRARCRIPSADGTPDTCDELSCSLGYVMRPSGVCKTVYGLGIGFPEDEFPISDELLRLVNVLIRCHLKKFDFVNENISRLYIHHRTSNNKRVFILQTNFYSSNSLLPLINKHETIFMVKKILHIARDFKHYRMKINQMKNEKLNINATSSEINIEMSPKYIKQMFRQLVKSIQRDRGLLFGESMPVHVCFCTSKLTKDYFPCVLVCVKDRVSQHDSDFLTDVCYSRFNEAMVYTQKYKNGTASFGSFSWILSGVAFIFSMNIF